MSKSDSKRQELQGQPTGRIEVWTVHMIGSEFILWGAIYDDIRERWEDGTTFHTSGIAGVDSNDLKKGMVVTTRNSTYLLGDSLVDVLNSRKVMQ